MTQLLDCVKGYESLKLQNQALHERINTLEQEIEELKSKAKSTPKFKIIEDERGEELKNLNHPQRVNGKRIREKLTGKYGDISKL